MRVSTVALLAVIAGGLLGAAISWANFGRTPAFEWLNVAPEIDESTHQPLVLVAHTFHDFGLVQREKRISHAFRFTNKGKSTLVLKEGGTSCSQCTIAKLEKPRVEPGETVDVVVEYMTSGQKPQFQQVATVLTNDPNRPNVELEIVGTVVSDYDLRPGVVDFGTVTVDETKTVNLTLTCGIVDRVRIVKHDFADPQVAPYFDVSSRRLTPEELKSEESADGYRIALTLKPGLPLKPFQHTIRFELSVDGRNENPVTDVVAQGTVEGEIAVIGAGWDKGRLKLGAVKQSEGAIRKLFVLVRGANRGDVSVKLASVKPDWLKATLGQPEEMSSGTATRIPLTIEIPPGTLPGSYLGTDQGDMARIVLETTHPQVKEVPVNVQFVVER